MRQRPQCLKGAARVFLYAIVALVLIATSRGSFADDLLSPEEFTRAFIAKAETVARDRTFTMAEPLSVAVAAKGGVASSTSTIYLGNVYRAYVADPESLDGILRGHIRGVLEAPSDEQVNSRDQLLPVIRYRDYIPDRENVASEPFVNDMLVFYVFDHPDSSAFARNDEIKTLGIESKELKALSLDNLRQNMPDPLVDTGEGLTIIDGGGSYLTGLLLLDEYWTASRFPHRGDPVVFVIGRELMLVTGSEEKAVIDSLREQSKKLVEEIPYPVSDQPIVRRNGRWEAY